MPRPRSVRPTDNGGLIPKGSLSAEEETYEEEAFHVRVKSKKLSLHIRFISIPCIKYMDQRN